MLEAALCLQDVRAVDAHVEKRYGFEIPEEVDTALQALHELIEYLQSELPSARQGGRIRDGRYRLCAAVCAEVWRRQHDKLEPYSRNLWQACEKYWQACGQPGTSAKGNLDNWEPRLEWVRDGNDADFRDDLERRIARLPTP